MFCSSKKEVVSARARSLVARWRARSFAGGGALFFCDVFVAFAEFCTLLSVIRQTGRSRNSARDQSQASPTSHEDSNESWEIMNCVVCRGNRAADGKESLGRERKIRGCMS